MFWKSVMLFCIINFCVSAFPPPGDLTGSVTPFCDKHHWEMLDIAVYHSLIYESIKGPTAKKWLETEQFRPHVEAKKSLVICYIKICGFTPGEYIDYIVL